MKKGPWRDCLRFTSAEWRDGLRAVVPHAEVFLGLVKQFELRYRHAKEASRAIDFSDLERFALRVLRDPDHAAAAPSAAARAQHRRFRHVLVDEYQDINEVQDAILTLVSRECLDRGGTTGRGTKARRHEGTKGGGGTEARKDEGAKGEPPGAEEAADVEPVRAALEELFSPSPGTPGEGRGEGLRRALTKTLTQPSPGVPGEGSVSLSVTGPRRGHPTN